MSPRPNEKRVLFLLKSKLKATGAAVYLPDFPIMKPREERVKMRLLLGTNNPRGLEVFRDVQEKVERTEIETRNKIRNAEASQARLFDDDAIAEMQQRSAGVGCPANRRAAQERIVETLTAHGSETFSRLANEVLEAIPIRLTQLKDLFGELKKSHIVNFELPPRKRVPQPNTRIVLASRTG